MEGKITYNKEEMEMCKGVKGFSLLQYVPHFDNLNGFPPDPMHSIYLCAPKQSTLMWFGDTCIDKDVLPFILTEEKQKELDDFLESIVPPHFISRCRAISPNSKSRRGRAHWKYKAHEWQMFLLYYSGVGLKGILSDEFYENWLFLVRGVSLLSYDDLTEERTALAEINLLQFCKGVGTLYPTQASSYNVHLLQHFPLLARRFGSLYQFSMAGFESFNFEIKSAVKGSQFPASQIIKW